MELKIKVTSKNVNVVARFLKELAYADTSITPVPSEESEIEETANYMTKNDFNLKDSLLKKPEKPEITLSGDIVKNETTTEVGNWGLFNSFFPIKAVLRVLINRENENEKSLTLRELVEICRIEFSKGNLRKLRGLPSNLSKESSIGRLVWHFIGPAREMGFIVIEGEVKGEKVDYIPISDKDWNKVRLFPTKDGAKFALLENNVFDKGSSDQVLTIEERKWLMDYLKKIEKRGHKEFTILKKVFEFLSSGHDGKEDLRSWFRNNSAFLNYIKKSSSKSGEALNNQLDNLSITFAASKLALLREFGLVSNKRGDYSIIGDLNEL
ncbi:MAG: hypothetical protein JXC85_06215 [Candidatus Aenigmarchaeota archaeon]|nr:hypothetical protein [Candidatus Aenigmarchaeota archaeon]